MRYRVAVSIVPQEIFFTVEAENHLAARELANLRLIDLIDYSLNVFPIGEKYDLRTLLDERKEP